MADVKWIKLKVGMFDGESFKKIKRAKIGGESFRDKLTAVWFELMDLAGKCNHAGAFINSKGIPYTSIDDIATQIDRDNDELSLCMNFFINEGMVSLDEDIYSLANWQDYQNVDALDDIRERKRIAQQKWREKKKNEQKMLPSDSDNLHVESTENLHVDRGSISLISNISNKEIGECEGKEKTEQAEKIRYEEIKQLYNATCVSFPKCTAMSEARKKAIKARFSSGYSMQDFQRLFEKAQSSSFLKGKNTHNWRATFDWLVKDSNMAKVLDGNYDDKAQQNSAVVDDLDFIPN